MNGIFSMENISPAAAPLTEILETYSQCLALSRDYIENDLKDSPDNDVDVDKLEQFLHARADLFGVAESSFNTLAECFDRASAYDEEIRKVMTARVIAILEEMTEVENQLASFLGDRLNKMRETINTMKRTQPVFRRYGRLDAKTTPGLFTRHG